MKNGDCFVASGATAGTAVARTAGDRVWLYVALVLPSLFIVHKLSGVWVTVGYAAAVALVLPAADRIPLPRTRRTQIVCVLLTIFAVVLLFAAVYPIVNVHTPPRGSDDDDAYNVGVHAIVAGQSPYAERTYLGNVLHQLPGAFIVAAPFVLLGTSALQNLFWVAIFFAVVRAESAHAGRALRFTWIVLAFSPVVLHQIVTGTAHVANAIYVALGLWWLTRTRHRDLAAMAWGVAIASRANFFWTIPLAFGWLTQQHGWRVATRAILLTCATATAITLPFYVASPSDFGPLEAANRVTRFNAAWPHAGDAIVIAMTLLSVGLGWWLVSGRPEGRPLRTSRGNASGRPRGRLLRTWHSVGAGLEPGPTGLFRAAAIVQAFPVVAGTLLGILQWGRVDLEYTSYFTFAAWFALMAVTLSDRTDVRAGERREAHQDRRRTR
jgi:hypothetical protein